MSNYDKIITSVKKSNATYINFIPLLYVHNRLVLSLNTY